MASVRTAADIGEVIRAARVAQGLSQTELAQRAGLRQPKVSEIERGKDTAHIGIALRMIAALGLTIEIADPEASAQSANGPATAVSVLIEQPQPDDSIDLDAIVGSKGTLAR